MEDMPYSSEIVKIIEAGLERDSYKVRAYVELLVQKMKYDDFDLSLIKMIEKRLDGSYKNMPKVRPFASDLPSTPPSSPTAQPRR